MPKDKLLEFNVKDGVKRLSDFAGKKTPDWPMPYVNDSSEFLRRRKIIMGGSLFLYLRKFFKLHLTTLKSFLVLGITVIGMIKGETMMVVVPLSIIVTLQCLSTAILHYLVKQSLNKDRNKKVD